MILSSFLHTVNWFQLLLYNNHNLTSVIWLFIACSISAIDITLSGVTVGSRVDLESRCTSHSPDFRGLNHIIRCFNVVSRSYIGGGLTSLQRCSWCILQSQATVLMSICLWYFIFDRFDFLFQCYIKFRGLFKAKTILIEEKWWYYRNWT